MADQSVQLYQLIQQAANYLTTHHHGGTAEATTYWLEAFDWNYTDFVLKQREVLSDQVVSDYWQVIERIVLDEPIQYITRRAYFNGRTYTVTPDTLIPRPETQELLDHLPEEKQFQRILDIGTGSGVLAVELALKYPEAEVVGTDINAQTLAVARQNGEEHQVIVDWQVSDLFVDLPAQTYDLIVSNPPYISLDELDLMDASVKKFEPNRALYGGIDGLAIYRRLAQQLPSYVEDGTLILFEIGYRQADAVRSIFAQAFPQSTLTIIQDYNQCDRFLKIEVMKDAN